MAAISPLNASLIFISGFSFFTGLFLAQLYFWLRTKLGIGLRKRYDLSRKDCSDISNKLVSAVQAIMCSVAALMMCSSCYKDLIHCSDPVTLFYACFGSGYFIYDLFSMFYVSTVEDGGEKGESYWKKLGRFLLNSPVMVAHHLGLVVGGILVAILRNPTRPADFIVGTVYLMEASTPFVSLRSILSTMKMKSSLLYLANGILLLLFFPLFRILNLVYTAHLYGLEEGMTVEEVLYEMPLGWKLTFVALIAPQVYWCRLILLGAARMIIQRKKHSQFRQ
ncbi:Protein FAM57A [Orchesella cincta]|uniref:Protein FAM57A n=1 Tax=Orchesella cincta TaxID=48709 RepID=A0A1D2MZ95_ORCCI|nr:Protein FAM57A [Orchesella cincta]